MRYVIMIKKKNEDVPVCIKADKDIGKLKEWIEVKYPGSEKRLPTSEEYNDEGIILKYIQHFRRTYNIIEDIIICIKRVNI